MIDPKSASEDLPELTDPWWSSRSRAGTTPGTPRPARVEHLELIWDAQPLAALDPEDYYDFQVNRPTVSLVGRRQPAHRVADHPASRWPGRRAATATSS